MHATGRPDKLEFRATKPLTTQRDLTLAYSPGVAAPCMEIHRDADLAYDYTAVGNIVAIVSNGMAVLGLGNIGALAAKPVMEGKSLLFRRFVDVDRFNVEVHSEKVDEVVETGERFGPSLGGINLEDIKAPECFLIEQRLREELGGGNVLGTVLMGLSKPAQVVPMGTKVSDMAALTAQAADDA